MNRQMSYEQFHECWGRFSDRMQDGGEGPDTLADEIEAFFTGGQDS